MPGRLTTVAVNREERYALEVETATGRCFLSIPVANRAVDYSEFYEIDQETLDRFQADPDSAIPFVWKCRAGSWTTCWPAAPGRSAAHPASPAHRDLSGRPAVWCPAPP
jgi:hypothetical protein